MRFEGQTEVLSKENYLLYCFSQKSFPPKNLENFMSRLLIPTIYREVPRLFAQQDRRGLVDKTTAQQPKVQQFETDCRQEIVVGKFSVKTPQTHNISGSSISAILFLSKRFPAKKLRKFSVKTPQPHNISGSSKITLSTRPSWSSG